MLKQKLQYFGHLMQTADSLENTLMLGKIESRRRMVGWNHQFNGSELMRLVTLYRRQGSRPSPWKRNAKKTKWLSGEDLQIAVKRREVKSKGEKERYRHLNAEFQRIERRDKKAFFRDQCKEIEENNRMGKTRHLFKKIRDTKGIFHAKMGSIKDRNCGKLTEAKDIKKRWQEYTEEPYKKDLHYPDNHDGMISHLEKVILE